MKKTLNFYTAQIQLSILAIVLTALCTEAASANRTWNGSTDGNWGTAANWTPSGSPALSSPYDSLNFAGTSRLATTNNLSSLTISNLTFSSGGFSANGNPLIIFGPITNLSGVNVINVPVTLAKNPKTWDVAAGAEIDFTGGSGTATYTGNPPFEKYDAGNVRFSGVNLWAQGADIAGGSLILDSGSLTITNDGFRFIAANGAWAGLIITNGGTLTLGANSVGKSFNLKLGSTANLSGTNELDIYSGQIALGQNLTQFIVGAAIGTYGIVNQYGGAIIYTNANAGNGLLLANAAGSIGIYNLNGGLLQVPLIQGGSGGGSSYFNFNGGTLTPYTALNAGNFIQSLTALTVKNDGAVIDTTNINLTISQPLLNGGSGGLTKLGVGTLTLAGANTYIGTSVISAGELIVPTLQTGAGAFQVADNTALGVNVAAAGTSLKTTALTLGSSAGATNEFFLGATGNPTSPVIVATNLTVHGGIVVNVYGAGFSIGQFSLIKYGTANGVNSGSFQLNLLPAGVSAYVSNNIANASVDLVITAAPTILWTGAANNSWDIGASVNWYDPVGLQAVTYSDGSAVRFDDTATGSTSISLATTVSPGGIIVTNNSATYSFSGSGSIAGAGALTKSGTGTLIVSTPNTYSGNTVINGGLLQLGNPQAIPGGGGAGNVTLNGQLDLAGNSPTINGLNGSGSIQNSSGSSTVTVGGNNASGSYSGIIADASGSITLVKTGSGTETLTANNNFSGGTTVAGGTLQVGGGSLGSGSVSLQTPSAGVTLASYSGSVNLSNPVYVFGTGPANFDTTGGDILLNAPLTDTGPNIIKKGYNNLLIEPNGAGYASGSALQLYQGNVTVDGGVWTNLSAGTQFYANGTDTVRLVVTNGGTYYAGFGGTGTYNLQLGYTPGLTGTNKLDISSGQLVFGPTFRQIIAGNSVGTIGVVNQTGGTIWFQAATNSGTGIKLGNNTNSIGQYYFNGGTLITPRILGGTGTGNFYFNGGTLTPASSVSASSFISALTGAYVGNGGAIFDTTNISVTVSQSLLNGGSGGLTKLGASTLTLTGTNTYTGSTLVSAGELWLPTTQLGGGNISVADGAALGITLAGANPTLATAALTFGNAVGATNDFNFGTNGNPAVPLVFATNLTVNGSVPVNVTGQQLALGQFSLIKYASATGLSANSFYINNAVITPGLAAYVSNNVANSSIDLVVTVAPTLTWKGNNGSAWDINTTTNWLNQGTTQPAVYTDASFVRLDDSASSTTVSLAGPVSPASVTFSNTVQNYSLTGSGGIGGIATFTKNGSGLVLVGTANTYTSNTVINAGTLQLGVNQAIPAGANAGNLIVNGKLDVAGFANAINGLSGAGVIDNSTGTGALTVGSNNATGIFGGTIGNSGGSLLLTKVGTGSLTLTANNSFSGGVTVSGGTLQIAANNSLGSGPLSFYSPSAGATLATYSGPLAIANPINITTVGASEYPANFDTTFGDLTLQGSVNANAADFVKNGSNTLRVAASASSILNGGKILLNQGDLIFDNTVWTNYGGAIRTFAPSGDIVHLALTNNALLSIGTVGSTPNLRLGYSAGLAGTNEFDISSGELILDYTFAQIFVGDASGTYGVFNQTGGTVLFQNNTNLSAGVTLGNSAGSTGWYYFNGGSLITPRIVGGSGTGYFYFNGGTLTPSSDLSATNFVSGFTAAYVNNGGAIVDTTNIDVTISQPLLANGSGGLAKLGAAKLTLTGANTYTGPTVVQNGTLELALPAIQPGSSVSIASGANLQLDFAGTNVVANLVLDGVSQPPGTYNSTTSPGFISGAGSLVVPVAGPGVFTVTPTITSYNFSGSNLTFTVSNGQAGDAYYLLSSTNLAQTSSQWRTIATNISPAMLGVNNSFTFVATNSLNLQTPQQFFKLSSTNFNP